MSYFKMLEEMVAHKVNYKQAEFNDLGMLEPAQNEEAYFQLKDEVNMYMSGTLAKDQLSPIALDVLKEFDVQVDINMMDEMDANGYPWNQEIPEDF